MLDLVGALQRLVDPPAELGAGIGRVERLVGIHGAGGVGVGGDLPARKIDRLEAGPDHLHRLVAGDRAQRVDMALAAEQLPEPGRAAAGEAVFDCDRAAQPLDVAGPVGPLDAVEPARRRGNDVAEITHLAASLSRTIKRRESKRGSLEKGRVVTARLATFVNS